MQLPKFYDTFIPILEVLSNDKSISYTELRKKVRDKYYSNLPEELLNLKTKSGDILILNRIGWAKGYLKMAKYLEQPSRGMVLITQKGHLALKKGSLNFQDIKDDPDYIAYEETRKSSKENNSNSEINSDNSTPQDLIDTGFRTIESQVKSELLEKLKTIDPFAFERLILKLLKKMGYGDVIETAKTGDGGIDGIINEDKLGLEKIYMQAKRYNENKVREKEIRNFIGAMSGDTSKGIFVTTSTFDDGAMEKAKNAHHKIILIDGYKLSDLMLEYNVGVQVKETYEIKEIDEDFFEGV